MAKIKLKKVEEKKSQKELSMLIQIQSKSFPNILNRINHHFQNSTSEEYEEFNQEKFLVKTSAQITIFTKILQSRRTKGGEYFLDHKLFSACNTWSTVRSSGSCSPSLIIIRGLSYKYIACILA